MGSHASKIIYQVNFIFMVLCIVTLY